MKIFLNSILQELPKNQNWRFFDTKFEKPITKRDIKKIKKQPNKCWEELIAFIFIHLVIYMITFTLSFTMNIIHDWKMFTKCGA
jgi:hypothetical protein